MSGQPIPELPLLLWRTPPGLEQMLIQEGVPFLKPELADPAAFLGGRFVVIDGALSGSESVRGLLAPGQELIDLADARRELGSDPFAGALETRPAIGTWVVAGTSLRERVCRSHKSEGRREAVAWLRRRVQQAGGTWANLGPFPFPYRSAFNLRVDLDEDAPEDYDRFAEAREPFADCTTHFVCTRAYGGNARALADLRGRDVQAHGHDHVVYRDESDNRRNIEASLDVLRGAGFDPVGFAGPEGRWNPGLDRALESLGIAYSSEFQVGFDDSPFSPWRGDGFSGVLQIPVHPVCEGLFLEAGLRDARLIGAYLAATVRRKVERGEPAFVYGHPERRLGAYPEILAELARGVAHLEGVWRVTLTEFAAWWRSRSAPSWSLKSDGLGRLVASFEGIGGRYPLALEVWRGERHKAVIPVRGGRVDIATEDLAFAPLPERWDSPGPALAPPKISLRGALRSALDWETVTPLEELPATTTRHRIKRVLRRWRDGRRTQGGRA